MGLINIIPLAIMVQHSFYILLSKITRSSVCYNEKARTHPDMNINPYTPSGLFHPLIFDGSIFNFRGVWSTFFISIIILIEIPVSKQ